MRILWRCFYYLKDCTGKKPKSKSETLLRFSRETGLRYKKLKLIRDKDLLNQCIGIKGGSYE